MAIIRDGAMKTNHSSDIFFLSEFYHYKLFRLKMFLQLTKIETLGGKTFYGTRQHRNFYG